MRQLRTLAIVTVVPTAVDVSILVALRQGLGWPVIVSDLVAIAVASVVSYSLHRVATYRSNPFYRWVRHPGAFALIATGAALVDAVTLRLAFTATGYETTAGLLLAKAVALAVAVPVRAVGYRFVLADTVVEHRRREEGRPPSSGELRFSVVVPAYREQDRIGTTVTAIRDALAPVDTGGGVEIIVVDDGSGDATADRALAAGADQVVVLAENAGKGGAVRAGMLATRGRAVAFTDADLAYAPEHLLRLLASIEDGWDVVIGNRRHPESTGQPPSGLRAAGSRAVNTLASLALLAAPLDTQCGLKGFRGDVARPLFAATRIDGFAFDIEVLHLVERAEWSLTEVPVELRETGGGSTVDLLADVVRLAADLVRIRYWSSVGAYPRLRAERGSRPAV